MIESTLSRLAAAVDGDVQGQDIRFRGLCTDSRTPSRGSLFIALKGPRFDGHDYVQAAFAGGAAAALVARDHPDLQPALAVDDTLTALGQVGRWWREQAAPTVVGVTGSNGKTTVKQMLHAILSRAGRTAATRGNLNNAIGVPLTLARLAREDRFAVIEMGANHVGEIAYLADLARPDVGIVTNARPAHLEGFGSLDNIARGKGELFTALGDDGVAVINADDRYADFWRGLAGNRRILSFGLAQDAAVRGELLDSTGGCRMHLPAGTVELRLPVPGSHNLCNALAAVAAAVAVGCPESAIVKGLEAFEPPAGRLRPRPARCGAAVMDDSYNANPASLEAGVQVLVNSAGEPWVALGDMAELGPEAEDLHHAAGVMMRDSGVRRLYACGPLSSHAVRGFGSRARHFDDRDDLIAALEEDLTAGVTLLVKGSRASGMEAVVARLCPDDDRAGGPSPC